MKVFVYVFDALRPDFLSCYSQDETTSANIDRFMSDAVQFMTAYSTTTWTKPSAGSLLSGRYPRELEMLHQLDSFPDLEWTLPTELSEYGFKTHCISSNNFVSKEFGFDCFDNLDLLQFDESIHDSREILKTPGDQEKNVFEKMDIDELIVPLSEDIHSNVQERLGERDDEFFLLWSIDTHGPYFVRGDTSWYGNKLSDFIFEKEVDQSNIDHVKRLYRDMIRYNDSTFGDFVTYLREKELYDDALIIIVADHGESFGDHDKVLGYPIYGHTDIVYEESVRVPLAIKFPQNERAGTTVEEPVQITDIYPTILDVIGETPSADSISGQSLYSSDLSSNRSVFIESHITPSSIYSAAIRKGEYKYIDIEKPVVTDADITTFGRSLVRRILEDQTKLYDLSVDPNERSNLVREGTDIASELATELERIRSDLSEATVDGERDEADISAEREEQLQLLGYSE